MFDAPGASATYPEVHTDSPLSREIVVMPEVFVVASPRQGKNAWFVVLGILVFLGALAGGIFLFLRSPVTPVEQPPHVVVPEELPPVPPPSVPEEPVSLPPSEPPLVESNTPTPSVPLAPVSVSQDSDGDGLTDLEEELFDANPLSADTDNDTYTDSQEVQHLFSPRDGNKKTLTDAGLVLGFTAPSSAYTFVYPTSWLVRPLEDGSSTVIVMSPTGEFIEMVALPKQASIPLDAWVSSETGETGVLATHQNALELVWSMNHRTAYISAPSGTTVYRLTYTMGARTEINFPNVVDMMSQSMSLK